MNNHIMYEGKKSKVAWPLAFIVGLVPLIVRMKSVPVPRAAQALWANSQGRYNDFFSANKLIVLGILTVISLVLFIKETNKSIEYNNKPVYVTLGVFMIFSVLSTVFAERGEKLVALFGIPGRYEGLIALIFYTLIMLMSVYVAKDWWNVTFIYKGLSIGGLIMGIIGLSQMLGHDILQINAVKALMLPAEYIHAIDELEFKFASRIYGTVFNPNYVGSYAVMLIPISFVAMLYTYLYSEDISKKIKSTILVGLMTILWFGSYSRGALLGGLFALALILVFLGKDFIKTKKQLGIFVVIFLALIFIVDIGLKGSITRQIQSLRKEIPSFLASDTQKTTKIKDIRLEGDGIEIDSNIPSFRVEKDGDGILISDDKGNLVETSLNEKNILTLQDDRYKNMYIEYESPKEFRINIKDPKTDSWFRLYFVYVGDEIPEEGYMVVVGNGHAYKIEDVESWGFEGKERIGSGRGYIWSRTFPMIKDTWLLGYGPDTYSLHFPQHDIIGKINTGTKVDLIIDKPHNLYLQRIVSTGLPSLLALIILFILYTIMWYKHIKNTERQDIRRWMSIAIYAALCGYLITGFFNDSVVSVAPIFWVIWGLGIGLASNSRPVRLVKK